MNQQILKEALVSVLNALSSLGRISRQLRESPAHVDASDPYSPSTHTIAEGLDVAKQQLLVSHIDIQQLAYCNNLVPVEKDVSL